MLVIRLIFSPFTGTTNLPFFLTVGSLVPVNQSVVPFQLRNRVCEGTEQNLLNSTCDGTRSQFNKRQTIQQPCRRDAAVTCTGMFIYKTYTEYKSLCLQWVSCWRASTCTQNTLVHLSFKQIWWKRWKEFIWVQILTVV